MQLRTTLSIPLTAVSVYLALSGVASAGTHHRARQRHCARQHHTDHEHHRPALFDEMFQGIIPADQYPGMTFHTGEFAMINPLIMEMGEVPDPRWTSPGVHFPDPVAGGGVQNGYICQAGGAVTFADPITQFGLTAGGSHALYITAWDANFVIIGQVTWQPAEGDSAFARIDTMGVPFGPHRRQRRHRRRRSLRRPRGVRESDDWMWASPRRAWPTPIASTMVGRASPTHATWARARSRYD